MLESRTLGYKQSYSPPSLTHSVGQFFAYTWMKSQTHPLAFPATLRFKKIYSDCL